MLHCLAENLLFSERVWRWRVSPTSSLSTIRMFQLTIFKLPNNGNGGALFSVTRRARLRECFKWAEMVGRRREPARYSGGPQKHNIHASNRDARKSASRSFSTTRILVVQTPRHVRSFHGSHQWETSCLRRGMNLLLTGHIRMLLARSQNGVAEYDTEAKINKLA